MALQYEIDRESGAVDAMSQKITVWTDDNSDLSRGDAIAKAQLEADSDMFGVAQDSTPDFQRLSPYAAEVTINYRYRQLTALKRPAPPEAGTLTIDGGPYEVKPKFMKQFMTPLGVFDSTGDVTSLYGSTKWLINPSQPGRQVSEEGAWIQPFPKFFTYNYTVVNATITTSYVKGIAALIAAGACNDSPYMDEPAGSIQLVSFSLSQRTPDDWSLRFEFGYKEFREDVELSGNVVIPELKGNSHYWTFERDEWNDTKKFAEPTTIFAAVGQVWPEADYHTILDLPGVT